MLRTWALIVVAAMLAGCASLPPPRPMAVTQAFADVADSPLARAAAAGASDAPAGHSGFRLLPEAAHAFDARIALARRATRSLDVQYYVWQSDGLGLRLMRELRDAAQRGVRVRLLLDDLYTGHQDALLAALAMQPNVELRLFNPLPARGAGLLPRIVLSLHDFGRINHRMHNKQFIADNSLSVSGGRNIADEYFMQGGQSNFLDMDVLASGPVVRQQSAQFDRYWNSAHVRPARDLLRPAPTQAEATARFEALTRDAAPPPLPRERDVLGRTAVSRQLDEGRLEQTYAPAEVFADDPDKIERTTAEARYAGSVTESTMAVLETAQSHVLIISPYFIPGPPGMAQMQRAAAKGVRGVIVTNSLGATDEPLVYAGYARYRDDMLRLGMTIYEFGPYLNRRTGQLGDFGASISRLHAKVAVIDHRRLFVGSMNLDGRSASLNTETGLLIDSASLAREVEGLLSEDRFSSAYQLRLNAGGRVEWVEQAAAGREIVHADEPDASWLRSFKTWLLSNFVAEELL